MRILYVIGGYGEEHLGGAIHRELAQEIIARGHAYEIFAPVHRRDMGGRSVDAVEDGVPVHRAVCGGRPGLEILNALSRPVFRFPWFFTFLLGFARFLRSRPPFEVIIAEGAYPLGSAVCLVTRVAPQPFILSILGADFIANERANYGYARHRLARILMRASFRRAALVRTISPYAQERAQRLGCPPAKLAVVQRNIARAAFLPSGTDREGYRRVARARVRERFGLSGPRLVVAVGRLLPIKGFDDLIRALPAVAAAVGEARVLLVGPSRSDTRLGDYRQHLESLARKLNVAERVSFAGALPHGEIRDVLAGADVVAVPSVEEGGNKVVMESAAVGTPFVVSRAAGNAEWAREWGCGVIVEPSLPDDLARGIVRVLGDPAGGESMGRKGVLFAEQFRPEPVAERILGLCRCVAEGVPLPEDLKLPEGLLHPVSAGKGNGA